MTTTSVFIIKIITILAFWQTQNYLTVLENAQSNTNHTRTTKYAQSTDVQILTVSGDLPHCGVDFELPVAVSKLDDESTNNDDDGAKSVSKNMKEHTTHVQLCT